MVILHFSVFFWLLLKLFCSLHIGTDNPPQKIFERHASLADAQIINYRADSKLQWLCLVGIAQRVCDFFFILFFKKFVV